MVMTFWIAGMTAKTVPGSIAHKTTTVRIGKVHLMMRAKQDYLMIGQY